MTEHLRPAAALDALLALVERLPAAANPTQVEALLDPTGEEVAS